MEIEKKKLPYGLERCIEHEHKKLALNVGSHFAYPLCCNSMNEMIGKDICPYALQSEYPRPYCTLKKNKI